MTTPTRNKDNKEQTMSNESNKIETEDRMYTYEEAYAATAGAALAAMHQGMVIAVKAVADACAKLGVTLPLEAAQIAGDTCAARLLAEAAALEAGAPWATAADRGAN